MADEAPTSQVDWKAAAVSLGFGVLAIGMAVATVVLEVRKVSGDTEID